MEHQSSYKIIISPIGDHGTELFKPVAKEIQRIFAYPSDWLPLLEDVNFALNPDRNQYHSTVILEKLAGLMPSQGIRVLAITQKDLFIPILTHVYGEAQIGGSSCIISTYRLKENLVSDGPESKFGVTRDFDYESYLSRVIKEAIHELGHTFKLLHCKDHSCIMHYCRSIQDVDRKSNDLCRYCKILLADEKKRMAKNMEIF